MRGEADRKKCGRSENERRQTGRETLKDRCGGDRDRGGYDRTTKGDMKTDSQGPHKLEHSQAKSKPPLCLCLSAKARLNKDADSGGGRL